MTQESSSFAQHLVQICIDTRKGTETNGERSHECDNNTNELRDGGKWRVHTKGVNGSTSHLLNDLLDLILRGLDGVGKTGEGNLSHRFSVILGDLNTGTSLDLQVLNGFTVLQHTHNVRLATD